jgi:hypothetical protein
MYTDTASGITTTSASIVDMTGLSIDVELLQEGFIMAFMSLDVENSSNNRNGFFAISIDGIDSPEIERRFSANDPSSVSVVYRAPIPLAAGTYTVTGRWYATGGTLTANEVELVAIPMETTSGATIPTAYDSVSTDTTTSTVYEPVDGLSATLTTLTEAPAFGALAASTSVSANNRSITTRLNIGDGSREIIRTYSPSSDVGSSAIAHITEEDVVGNRAIDVDWLTDASTTATMSPGIIASFGLETSDEDAISYAFDNILSDTTTSAALEDIDGLSVTINVGKPSYVFVALNANISASNNNTIATYNVEVNGVDGTSYTRYLSSPSDIGSIVIYRMLGLLDAGSYTITGRHATSTGTLTTTNANLSVIVGEVESGGISSSSSSSVDSSSSSSS